MPDYLLYVDVSKESQEIEKELTRSGIEFMRVKSEPGGRILPYLFGPEGVFEGTADIRLYFLARKFRHAGT